MRRAVYGSLLATLIAGGCSNASPSASAAPSPTTCEELSLCCETLGDDDRAPCQLELEQAAGDEGSCGASLDSLVQAGMCGTENSEGGSGGAAGSENDSGPPPVCTAGLPDGFTAVPRSWALPTARCGVPFDRLAGSDAVSYATFDFSRDRLPDLVVFSDTCDASVGRNHWDVYRATETGFEAGPRSVNVPTARCGKPVDGPSGHGATSFELADIDGDGVLEFVVTRDDCDAEIGSKRWDLYRFDGEHFAQVPSGFQLPSSRCGASYDRLASTGTVEYSIIDLTGDGRADLVVTSDGCDAEVGVEHWDVYPGVDSWQSGPCVTFQNWNGSHSCSIDIDCAKAPSEGADSCPWDVHWFEGFACPCTGPLP